MAKRQRRRRWERRKGHSRREQWQTRRSLITGVGVTAGALAGFSAPALGATYTVDSTADPGNGACDSSCTLREAVEAANTDANTEDDIVFASGLSGTITLTEQIVITSQLNIRGPGPGTLTVSGDDNSRIFGMYMENTGDEVYIGGLTLADGYADFGGALLNVDAELGVRGSVLTGNTAYAGGAFYEVGGTDNGRFTEITFSTLSHNRATFGGAIASHYFWGLVGGSTLYDNTAYAYGGAIITDTGGGGEIFDSTISGNHAYSAGGVSAYFAYTADSIFANNTANPGFSTDVYVDNFRADFDLVEDPHGNALTGSQNITGVDPQLGTLANNGGPTPTLRQAAGSPVVDQGLSYPGVSDDQRFSDRPVDIATVANAPGGNGADIGAVELTQGEFNPPTAPTPPASAPAKKKCKKKKKKHSAAAAKKKKCKKKKNHAALPSAGDRAIQAWRARYPGEPRQPLRPSSDDRGGGSGSWADAAWWDR